MNLESDGTTKKEEQKRTRKNIKPELKAAKKVKEKDPDVERMS